MRRPHQMHFCLPSHPPRQSRNSESSLRPRRLSILATLPQISSPFGNVLIPDDKQSHVITMDVLGYKTQLSNPKSRLSNLCLESPGDNTYAIVQSLPLGNTDT